MWWLRIVEVTASVLMFVLGTLALKAPTFPSSERRKPRRNVPDCKQTSEVKS